MTARSIERLWIRLMWTICLVVIVRWLVIHKLDHVLHGQTLRNESNTPAADDSLVVRSLGSPRR